MQMFKTEIINEIIKPAGTTIPKTRDSSLSYY
jgi:hypothetical protein